MGLEEGATWSAVRVSRTEAFVAQQDSPRVTCKHTPGQLPAARLLPDCPLCGCEACPTVEAGAKHDSWACIIIPYFSRKEVYAQYLADFERFSSCTSTSRPLSRERFCHEWREKLPHIKVSRLKSAWARCDECTTFRTLITSAPSKEERQRLKTCYESHLDHQRRQRAKYYKHRNKAIQHPQNYISIIMDGMDQKKSELPREVRQSKTSKEKLHLKQKLMGCLVHGEGMYLYLLASPVLKAGANFATHCLWRTLEEVGNAREKGGHSTILPDVLYLQLDNASDNKNKTLTAFCSMLVEKGIFRKVKLSFLLVGHTHEDVDQYFRYFQICTAVVVGLLLTHPTLHVVAATHHQCNFQALTKAQRFYPRSLCGTPPTSVRIHSCETPECRSHRLDMGF